MSAKMNKSTSELSKSLENGERFSEVSNKVRVEVVRKFGKYECTSKSVAGTIDSQSFSFVADAVSYITNRFPNLPFYTTFSA